MEFLVELDVTSTGLLAYVRGFYFLFCCVEVSSVVLCLFCCAALCRCCNVSVELRCTVWRCDPLRCVALPCAVLRC